MDGRANRGELKFNRRLAELLNASRACGTYDKLLAAAANGNTHSASPPNGSSGASGSTPGGSAPHLPRNWREIGVGDLVVTHEGDGRTLLPLSNRLKEKGSPCG